MDRKKFNDYEGFVEKFKPKKTTDDCYTPPAVYDAVVDYVGTLVDLSGREIVRPFYPGGDYENYDYPENCIVIDNPPFSILAKIKRYYKDKGIVFFLFAPHLTLFSSSDALDYAHIGADAPIMYENGAIVKTSFVTNIIDDVFFMTAPELRERITAANKKEPAELLPKYEYPPEVFSAAMAGLVSSVPLKFKKTSVRKIGKLDSQVKAGKQIFGGGMLLSKDASKRLQEAKRLQDAKRLRAVWELSDREREIVASLE